MQQQIIYTIAHPDRDSARIEVYGDPSNGWYEWRIVENGAVRRDTGRDNGGRGLGYGVPEIALRDALNEETGA